MNIPQTDQYQQGTNYETTYFCSLLTSSIRSYVQQGQCTYVNTRKKQVITLALSLKIMQVIQTSAELQGCRNGAI